MDDEWHGHLWARWGFCSLQRRQLPKRVCLSLCGSSTPTIRGCGQIERLWLHSCKLLVRDLRGGGADAGPARMAVVYTTSQLFSGTFTRLPGHVAFLAFATVGAVLSVNQATLPTEDVLSIFGLGFFCLCFSQVIRSWFRGLHDAQWQLMVEKSALEALLSMVCDATCWLAADADVIERGDSRCELLMGEPVFGKRLSACVVQTEEERRRLQDTFAPL
eukprot:CAMPEP_0179028820 /NCGR_PEP_ID=MMETSP0796-20121207/9738_1 /TAXON_ID=73915 /ORGANISM="Pyrodinium bahamense, Strain pbaha01" /LENGTH=217 /DNA_ID=CAMNT_0020724965 /DNA_START=108 /DNA_END=758 /DNA_ORIENTATION=+